MSSRILWMLFLAAISSESQSETSPDLNAPESIIPVEVNEMRYLEITEECFTSISKITENCNVYIHYETFLKNKEKKTIRDENCPFEFEKIFESNSNPAKIKIQNCESPYILKIDKTESLIPDYVGAKSAVYIQEILKNIDSDAVMKTPGIYWGKMPQEVHGLNLGSRSNSFVILEFMVGASDLAFKVAPMSTCSTFLEEQQKSVEKFSEVAKTNAEKFVSSIVATVMTVFLLGVRDVKGGNFMISPKDGLFRIDFGYLYDQVPHIHHDNAVKLLPQIRKFLHENKKWLDNANERIEKIFNELKNLDKGELSNVIGGKAIRELENSIDTSEFEHRFVNWEKSLREKMKDSAKNQIFNNNFEKKGLSCSLKETWEAGMKIPCTWQCRGTREMEEIEISINKTEKSISTKRRGL